MCPLARVMHGLYEVRPVLSLMVGFEAPLRRQSRACEICGRLIEGADPTDFMFRYGVHMRSHRAGGLRPTPPDDTVDKFK